MNKQANGKKRINDTRWINQFKDIYIVTKCKINGIINYIILSEMVDANGMIIYKVEEITYSTKEAIMVLKTKYKAKKIS